MTLFDYAAAGHAVPAEIVAAHCGAWARLASPGSWWTGPQRVAAARLARETRAPGPRPPRQRFEPSAEADLLPRVAADLVRKLAVDVHGLTREWATEAVDELGDAAYAELCAVVVCVTAIDVFAEALGVDKESLPEPRPGEPDGTRPEGMADAGAFVPMLDGHAGPNVGRALSLVPADNAAFFGLVGSMYAMANFTELVWEDGVLSRPQVELVAARVSAINECFY